MNQLPEPEWDLPDLDARPPAPVVPVPATAQRDLRGRRVVIGLPGLGWRGDLRGDAPVVQGSRTFVPVLAESEWYRAEIERVEVFATLVPIERVWVEVVVDEVATNVPREVFARLVSLDVPPRRDPVPAADEPRITGRRVVRASDEGVRRELRAVTEAYTSADGDICVRVATEADWYRWSWTGRPPKTLAVPVHLLWLE